MFKRNRQNIMTIISASIAVAKSNIWQIFMFLEQLVFTFSLFKAFLKAALGGSGCSDQNLDVLGAKSNSGPSDLICLLIHNEGLIK